MNKYEIRITNTAQKDINTLTPKLKNKLKNILLEVIIKDPKKVWEKLIGDLQESYSYRLTFKDRIIYSIDEKNKIIYIERARTHYGN